MNETQASKLKRRKKIKMVMNMRSAGETIIIAMQLVEQQLLHSTKLWFGLVWNAMRREIERDNRS
jgi:hypothetical protein